MAKTKTLFDLVLREFNWKLCSEHQTLIKIQFTSNPKWFPFPPYEDIFVVNFKENNEITIVSLEKCPSINKYIEVTISKKDFENFYYVETYNDFIPFSGKLYESEGIIYNNIPIKILIEQWYDDYYDDEF